MKKKYLNFFYALITPTSILPISIILNTIGQFIYIHTNWSLALILVKLQEVCFNNLPLMFSASLSFFMCKQKSGIAVFSGIISFIILTQILDPNTLKEAFNSSFYTVDISFSYINNSITGILCGLLSANVYDRFHNIRLPEYLSFFSGRRCVPIITTLFTILLAFILYYIWPLFFHSFYYFNEKMISFNSFTLSIMIFINQLLSVIDFQYFIDTFIVIPQVLDVSFIISLVTIPAIVINIFVFYKKKRIIYIIIVSLVYISCILGQRNDILNILLFIISPCLWFMHCACIGIASFISLNTTLSSIQLGILFFIIYFLIANYHCKHNLIKIPKYNEYQATISHDIIKEAIHAMGDLENIKELKVIDNFLVISVYDYEFFDSKLLKQLTNWKIERNEDFTYYIDAHVAPENLLCMIKSIEEEEMFALLI